MASWPNVRRTIGKSTERFDGPDKVTGRAKYTYDQNPAGLCYAVVLYAPVGRGRITKMDAGKASAMPGIKTVQVQRREGQEFRYHGDYLAIVVGETENQARDAARAIDFAYEPLPSVYDEPSGIAPGAPAVVEQGNLKPSDPRNQGDVDQALAQAAAVYEGDFRVHVKVHTCLESHGAVAAWDGDRVNVWSSTQGISGVREQVARFLRISPANVETICEYMGGGFGSKLGASEEGRAAALSKDVGAPVKFMLERELEQTAGGCERSAMGRIKLAADRDGNLTVCEATSYGSGGVVGNADVRFPFTYRAPNVRAQHTNVSINAGPMKAFRAPGHPVMAFIMETAMDGLADKLGMDPVAFRKKNLPGNSMWQQQLDLGAERIGWSTRPKTGSETGRFRRGLGVALGSWGGRGHDSNARMVIHADGTVEIYCATQDIGTGSRTVLAVVAAETLGLEPTDITVHIGHGSYPASGGSGGSTTVGAISAAARTVSEQAAAALFAKIAPGLGVSPTDLTIVPGGIQPKGGQTVPWKRACGLLGANTISVEANRDASLMGSGTNATQFAEVVVDVETGIVKVKKIVALQDCGMIINRLTCESQVIGAVIMALSEALFEERTLDPNTARVLNPNMEFYRLAGPSDIPEIEIHLQDQPERGPIGIGEPPAIPATGAIANAVANAIGVRITTMPLTPDRVLMALEGSR